jgi:hypothetical protein
MGIFTFGREHEMKCALRHVRDPAQAPLLASVVDRAHDLLEGKGSEADFIHALRTAFLEGGRSVWGNTEQWIRKFSDDYPALLDLWTEFASSPRSEIRWRVACVLDYVPKKTFDALSGQLANDKSKRVADMAIARIESVQSEYAT